MAQQQGLRAINILPHAYRQPLITLREAALLLVVLTAGIVFYLMAQSLQTDQKATAALQLQRDQLEAQLESAKPRIAEAGSLQEKIQTLQTELGLVHSAAELAVGKQADWDVLLTDLFDNAPPGMQLRAVYQKDGNLVVEGTTTQPFSVLATFVRQLSVNPEVTEVVVTRMETTQSTGATVFGLSLALVNG